MRRLLVLTTAVCAAGCGKIIYGSGDLMIWNGSDQAVKVSVDGHSSGSYSVMSHMGERLEGAVAGRYRVTEQGSGRVYELELKDGGTAVVNIGAVACFARSDISGMYTTGKEPVRLLQILDRADVASFDVEIPVLPGEPPPPSRPKSAYAFQRLSEVPCSMLRDEAALADWVRKTR
jgi:hypothetical protein